MRTPPAEAKSLYISPAVNCFYGTEYEIWAGFGLVGSTENFGLGLLRAIFYVFPGQNTVASTLKSCMT